MELLMKNIHLHIRLCVRHIQVLLKHDLLLYLLCSSAHMNIFHQQFHA